MSTEGGDQSAAARPAAPAPSPITPVAPAAPVAADVASTRNEWTEAENNMRALAAAAHARMLESDDDDDDSDNDSAEEGDELTVESLMETIRQREIAAPLTGPRAIDFVVTFQQLLTLVDDAKYDAFDKFVGTPDLREVRRHLLAGLAVRAAPAVAAAATSPAAATASTRPYMAPVAAQPVRVWGEVESMRLRRPDGTWQ